MKTLMFAATALLSASMLVAQEMAEADATEMTQDVATEVAEEFEGDGDVIAQEFTDTTPEVPEEFKSAEDIVKDELKKAKLSAPSYNRKKKAIIQIGRAEIKISDPASNKDFMQIRSATATEAYLNAKQAIIAAINTSFQGVDRQVIMAQYGEDPKQKEFVASQEALESKKAEIVKKMVQLDEAEARALEGITLSNRFGALLDGIIKKLDNTYTSDKIVAEKRQVRDEIARELNELKAEFKELESVAKSIPAAPKKELDSAISMYSKMPLLGATVLSQAESWDESTQIYQVAMAMVWSPKLQEQAEALTTSEGFSAGTPNPEIPDVSAWIEQQDLSVMIGPRSFVDGDGYKIFLGIAAADLTGSVIDRDIKREMADMNAAKAVAFTLMSDIESFRKSREILRQYGDDDNAALQSFSKTLSQSCDIQLQGCQPAGSVITTHPITGHEIYVSVYYLEPDLAQNAQELLENAYAGHIRQVKRTQYLRGRHAGAEQALNEARKSKEEFNRGVADGKGNVKKKVKAKKTPKSKGTTGSRKTSSGKSRGGGYSGSGTAIDTDF